MAEPAKQAAIKPLVVVSPSGKIGEIAPSDARDVLEAGGRVATPEEISKAQAEGAEQTKALQLADKYRGGNITKGLELEAGSRIAGGLRGFTGGVSDKLAVEGARALGGDSAATSTAAQLTEYDEAAPVISKGSEVSGIVAPMFAGRVPGITGKLAGGIPGLVGEVGRAGEGVAAGILGKGATSVGGRVAQRAIPAMAAGGLEGAAFGAGTEISESALGDKDLNAERLVASMKHGAFWGGALSGGVAGIGALRGGVPAAVERLASREGEVVEDVAAGWKPRETRGLPEGTGPRGNVYERSDFEAKAREAADRGVPRAAPEAAQATRTGSLAEMAGEAAEIANFKALGGTKAQAQRAMRNVEGGPTRIGSDFMADLEAQTGKSRGLHGVKSAYDHAVKGVDRLGEKLGTIHKTLDATGMAPDVAGYTSRAYKELVEPHVAYVGPKGPVYLPGTEAMVRPVLDHIEQIEAAFGGAAVGGGAKPATFEQWHKSRVLLDKTIKFNQAAQTPATQALRQLRGIMEGVTESAADQAASQAGGAIAGEYTATKSLYQSMISAREMLESKVASQDLTNRFISLGDSVAAIKGAIIGGIPGAIIGGVAGHVARTRGDFIAADLLHRASKLEMLGASSTRVNRQIEDGVRGLMGKPATKALAAIPEQVKYRSPAAMLTGTTAEEKRKAYQDHARELTAFQSNPALQTTRMAERLGGLPDVAPKTAAAVTATVQRGTSFLLSKMPPPRIDAHSLTPQFQDTTRISPYELSRFARYAQAVDDPLGVLELAHTGDLTRDHVEAVKEVYPKLYEHMRQTVLREVLTAEKPLTYAQEVQLGTLLDIPTNKTMDPGFLRAQGALAKSDSEEQPQAGGGATSPMGSIDLGASAFASAGDNIESGR